MGARSVTFLLAFAVLASAQAQKPLADWEKVDFSSTKIKKDDVSPQDAGKLRGIIFGKHGRIFKEADIQKYLDSRPWYHGDPKFTNSSLNDNEKFDLDVVREIESNAHDSIQPGDMRFWQSQEITEDQPVKDLTSIHIMKAEIEAIHGKTFPAEPEIQAYFDDRYWYKKDPTYNSSKLSEMEKKNLQHLANIEQKVHGATINAGDMELFREHELTTPQLKNISLFDLRIMRNSFYALEGYKFKTPWLQRYFGMFAWYKPKNDVTLSKIEKANVALIVARENSIHDGLAKTALDSDSIAGLFVEDLTKLQNEIYARHGKVFKQKWLQDYFESLPWYKANPHFSNGQLTAIERQNLELIAQASKSAESAMNAEEG
jgi:hypothetical protein